MNGCEGWRAAIEPMSGMLASSSGPGPGDDDDDDEDSSGGGSGGNIDPDDDEGYVDEEDEDEDEEPLRCTGPYLGADLSLRRSNPWYDARVRRSAVSSVARRMQRNPGNRIIGF
jgi:hypothetical protein